MSLGHFLREEGSGERNSTTFMPVPIDVFSAFLKTPPKT
jgi:hypothetical protein